MMTFLKLYNEAQWYNAQNAGQGTYGVQGEQPQIQPQSATQSQPGTSAPQKMMPEDIATLQKWHDDVMILAKLTHKYKGSPFEKELDQMYLKAFEARKIWQRMADKIGASWWHPSTDMWR